ncbi:hypothetical protein DYB32_010704 [Aphanomyces invadans]|uniref:SAP domain-containing protein n=1 Tax=Aphanomyces invadans TaxID=157072 RepID=A0A3R7CSG3_9STRA|nr:hypothetical protein DYB32_010704 [Aphanomyces invadans]
MSGKGDAAAKKAKSSKRNSLKGGNRKFVTSAEELEARNVVEEVRQEKRRVRRDDGDSGDDDEDDDDDGVMFDRAVEEKEEELEEKRVSKPKGVAGIIQVQNPNFAPASNKAIKAKDIDPNAEAQPLTRRERETLEKEAKAANYMKRHLAGQTAKRDIRRLEEVKKRREEAALRKKQEEEAAAELAKKAAKMTVKGGDEEALDARAIKALKPNVLKDYLKERGLSIQGQKADLIQRLIDYENEKSL